MCSEIVRGVPFYAADVRCGRNRRMFAGEVALGIGSCGFWDGRVGDDVYVVQEYPEYFFDDVVNFFVPDAVRAWMVD